MQHTTADEQEDRKTQARPVPQVPNQTPEDGMTNYFPRRHGEPTMKMNPDQDRRIGILSYGLVMITVSAGGGLFLSGCAVPAKTKPPTAYLATWQPASAAVVAGPVELTCFIHDETNLNFLDVTEAGAPVAAVSYLKCAVPDGPNKIDVQSKWPLDWPTWYSIWPPFDLEGPQTLSLVLPTSLLPPPQYRVIKLP